MPLAASGVTHQGRRSTNEDTWLVDLDLGLLVVADGMGGHNAGEVASALAVKAIRDHLRANQGSECRLLLEQAVQLANENILNAAAQQPDQTGMGTTVVAALVCGQQMYYMGVGDSRVYLLRQGELTQLTRDDSWLAAALEGQRPSRPLSSHPMRHVLTKVVGLRPQLQAVAAECPLEPDDCLLLCSDGVHGTVPDEMLAEILGSQQEVAAAAQAVVDAAIDRGATDNVTAIVACLVP